MKERGREGVRATPPQRANRPFISDFPSPSLFQAVLIDFGISIRMEDLDEEGCVTGLGEF